VTDDVLINGQKLSAGTYSLHTIPTKDEWTIIFNSDAGQWGSFDYDAAKDVLRVTAKPQWVADNQEWLLFSVPDVSPSSARVVIRWEKIVVPFTVEVPNVDALMRAKAQALGVANPNEWKIPLAVGNFYANDAKPEEALKWIDQSIKIKETFQNLSAKARQLAASGKKEEALAIADQALQRGKNDKVDTSRFEKWLTDLKAPKP
jgi:tetratricopeptide (TPR) repeat protein